MHPLPPFIASAPAPAAEELTEIAQVLHYCALAVSLVGAAVVLYGVIHGLFVFLRMESRNWRGGRVVSMRDELRASLGFYLLLGLEFLIAADIIETILKPSTEDVLVLGGIVLIRTVISFSLNWELKEAAADDDSSARR